MSQVKEIRVLMLGLDTAGKTTILYQLKLGEVVTTIPTIGFNVETVERNGVSFTMWDVGGQDKMRLIWRHYYQNTRALIFVVDSNDKDRIELAAEELNNALHEQELDNAVLLVYASKQDLPNAMSVAEITDKLGLNSLKKREWYITGCSALNKDSLYQGLDWVGTHAEYVMKPAPVQEEKKEEAKEEVKADDKELKILIKKFESIDKLVKAHDSTGSMLIEQLKKVLTAELKAKLTVAEDGTVLIDGK